MIAAGIHHISDSVFLSAAEGLADMVTEDDLAVGRLYPPLHNIREISVKIAKKVAEEAYQSGTASTYPEPEVSHHTLCTFYSIVLFYNSGPGGIYPGNPV